MQATTNYRKHTSANRLQRLLIERFYRALCGLIRPLGAGPILDVGCGEGFTLARLARAGIGRRLDGVDRSADALRLGREMHPWATLRQGDASQLPCPDGAYDLVLCTEVLEHLDDPAAAVGELKRVTREYLALSVPNEPFFMMQRLLRGKDVLRLGNHPEHVQRWTYWGFVRFLQGCGLRVLQSRAPFAWTLVLAAKGP
ncbi:MAG TPA: methyltransferase domain-containing protein [Gemmataceae bacterium]|jgi:2-polyprenyl-3-methyl-5-hydroxy-6-metoxy-1,4-benzoquinol methylase|nr:methyltransferase domain-containing protein [Gemmataceae bacterium]